MANASAHNKKPKQQARAWRDAAHDAFLVGDYRRAIALDHQVIEQAADPDAVAEAAAEIDRLAPDPWAIRVGAIAVIVYGVAWWLVLR